jgi:hypothetical protein
MWRIYISLGACLWKGRMLQMDSRAPGNTVERRGSLVSMRDMEPNRGVRVHIASIMDEQIMEFLLPYFQKVMQNYTRNECTLEVIIVAEFNKNSAPLNWCKYLLTEMLQECVDVHDKVRYFIYVYLLVAFSMWK